MTDIIVTSNFDHVDLNHPNLLISSDILLVECAEVWDDYINNKELRTRMSFGLTQLGGLTVQLGEKAVKDIFEFNYKIEEENEVGLCLPYNLLITPREFIRDIFTNNYDTKTRKFIKDIVEANEKHKKKSTLNINLLFACNIRTKTGEHISYWESEETKLISIQNLKKLILEQPLNITKKIYLVC